VALAFMVSIFPANALEEDSLPRAIWSTAQIILGLLMILAAQVWALALLAPEDDRLHFKDAIFAGRLWVLTVKRLPETRAQVYLGSWGLATMLAAILCIGGLAHWLNYLPKSSNQTAAIKVEAKQ